MNAATPSQGQAPAEQPTEPGLLLRYGTVTSVMLADGLCIVEIDDGEQTQPIRWFEGRAGATRSWSPPSVGEQVLLICPDGELSAATALRGLNSAPNPPIGNNLIERLRFDDGAEIRYDPENHRLEAVLPAGSQALIKADKLVVDGDLEVAGQLDVAGTIDAGDTISSDEDVLADGTSLKSHKHTGVSSGNSVSGEPQ